MMNPNPLQPGAGRKGLVSVRVLYGGIIGSELDKICGEISDAVDSLDPETPDILYEPSLMGSNDTDEVTITWHRFFIPRLAHQPFVINVESRDLTRFEIDGPCGLQLVFVFEMTAPVGELLSRFNLINAHELARIYDRSA